ncbi:MAG: phospho-N-acetylmuramoyl-pentapeptide-transferase [Candidatus Moranbacteria bacterium]|nr:phospho-N-acetylmuramoyl-pentapeptide-transferase [Candidatus Moranbacteria bacterium]
MPEVIPFSQIQDIPLVINLLKVLVTGFLAFLLAFLITPLWTNILYKYKIGIKIKETSVDGDKLTFVSKLHQGKSGTPTMGGLIVWFSVLLLVLLSHFLFPLIATWTDTNFIARLDFLKRSQVWLPLFVLVTAGILGLFDDYMSVRSIGSNKGGGMRFAIRFWWLFAIAFAGAWWFYDKLGWDVLHVPAVGDYNIGLWYIPLFIFVILFTAISSNETDGLDGLNAGVLLAAFSSFTLIAFVANKMDLAAFCAAIAGALLAFLWFNIYPARFFMGDTGAISLGTTLGVVAMLTNSMVSLFIIVFIYSLESGSAAIQILSKKFRGKKVFLAAPLHHHFEAKGWPEPKIVMRAWIFTSLTALLGTIIAILGMGV